MKAHSGNFARYSHGCPFFLAALLHPSPKQRSASLQLLSDFDSAFKAAAESTIPLIKDIVARSPPECTAMRWARRFGAACNFERCSEQLSDLVRALFTVCGQSKIVEDCIGILRDHETRDSKNTQMALFQAWNQPIMAKLIDQYRRAEIVPETSAPTHKDFVADKIFHSTNRSNDHTQDSVNLRKILGRQDWTTYNFQTCKNPMAEAQLILYLSRTGRWAEAEFSWQIRLVPEFQILRVNEPSAVEKYNFVVKVLDGAAIVWPLSRLSVDTFGFDIGEGVRFEWLIVLSYQNLMIQPAFAYSPLHCLVKQWPFKGTLVFTSTDVPLPLLDWQAGNGFVGVPEGVQRRLLAKLEAPEIPIEDSAGCEAKHCLTMALLEHFFPDMDREKALTLLLKGDAEENKVDAGYLDDITTEMVMDVVLAGEQKGAADFIKTRKAAKSGRESRRASFKSLVQRRFDDSDKPKAKPLSKRQQVQLSKKAETDRTRYIELLRDKPLEVLLGNKPEAARVCIDNREGRFRLSYPGAKGMSFAWGERGQAEAVKLSWRQMWKWEKNERGREPPSFLAEAEAAL